MKSVSLSFYCLPACLPGVLEMREGGKHKQLVSAEGNKFYSDEAVRKSTMKPNLQIREESSSQQESSTDERYILGNTQNGEQGQRHDGASHCKVNQAVGRPS